MINHEQIKKMLDCYGADLGRWPGADKRALAKFIEDDKRLSDEQADARLFDLAIRESLESFEPEWPLQDEKRLSEKIINRVDRTERTQSEISRWQGWFKAILDHKALSTIPALSVALVLFVFVVAIQVGLQNEQPLDNSVYSMAELDDWLVFEGIAIDPELSVGSDLYELAIFENGDEVQDDSIEPEIYFLL